MIIETIQFYDKKNFLCTLSVESRAKSFDFTDCIISSKDFNFTLHTQLIDYRLTRFASKSQIFTYTPGTISLHNKMWEWALAALLLLKSVPKRDMNFSKELRKTNSFYERIFLWL